jgi:hypothetical protein
MKKKHKIKKVNVNEIPVRNEFLMDGPIQTQVDGTPKGKKGYNRKKEKNNWKKDLD